MARDGWGKNPFGLMSILLVIIGELVGAYIGPILFGQLNSAYTSVANTSLQSTNQSFIGLVGLGYILALILAPIMLIGFEAYREIKENRNLIDEIIELFVFALVGVILYVLLVSPFNSLYNAANGYSWAKSYAGLIPLGPMFVIIGIFVAVIVMAVNIVRKR